MDERHIRAHLSAALKEELADGKSNGFFFRWFRQRRETASKADAWSRLAALYAPDLDQAGRQRYYDAARALIAADKHLPFHRVALDRALGQLETAGPDQAALDRLHRVIRDAFVLRDVRTYYYDTFDPGRKKSRDLELLDAFCRERGLALQSSGGGRMSEEELRDWDKLAALLRAEGQDEVFLPVCADPKSGAGLYLVGLRYIPRALARRRRDPSVKSCYYVFLLPFDLQEGEDEMLDLVLEEDPDIRLPDYPSAKEAESWFWGFGAVRAAERLQGWNETAPAGCPPRFLDRFRSVRATVSKAELARRGRLAFEADS